MIHYLTETPRGNTVVLAAADTNYFRTFGPAFVASSLAHGLSPHIHLIAPTPDDVFYAYAMKAASKNIMLSGETPTFSMEHMEFPLAKIAHVDLRTYYACNRFLVAPYIMKHAQYLYISDIDAIWKKTPIVPSYNHGLYLREPIPGTVGWENEGTHVAAGLVFASGASGYEFLHKTKVLIKELTDQGNSWFTDQVALWRVYNEFRETDRKFHIFDSYDMDWEFTPNSCMWTAKGNRKSNPIYVNEQNRYAQMLQS